MSSAENLSDRVNLIAVGIENYLHLERLTGPAADVQRIKKLLSDDQNTSTIPHQRAMYLYNTDSATLRERITEYALGRSADNDILMLYFSGHATRIGNYDLGMCTVDTSILPTAGTIPPLSIVRFSDIVETLASVKVDPVIIIDACYSGAAGRSIQTVYEELKRQIQGSTGSTYALLCSSRSTEESHSLFSGGIFSEALFRAATAVSPAEDDRRKPWLSLQDLYPAIRKELELSESSNPQVFLGATLPAFPFVRNARYQPRTERFHPSHIPTLLAFWNDGSPIEIETSELIMYGSTTYTTNKKLGYSPAWALIEEQGTKVKLTQRGIDFIHGLFRIPLVIVRDEISGTWHAAPEAKFANFNEIGAP
jgi:hypothetical protein